MLTNILIGWAVFVAFVYLLMWMDCYAHKHDLASAFRRFIASFGEE